MKKISIILVFALLLGLFVSCGSTQSEPRENLVRFTDSLNRTVEVPQDIARVAVTGPLAQIVVYSLAPDKLVALSSEWNSGAEDYIDEKYRELPLLGQLYGGSADLNAEELMKADPQVIVDVGEAKKGMEEDLDALQQTVNIPVIHISAELAEMADSYLMLGELLGMEEEAKTRSAECTRILNKAEEIIAAVGSEGKTSVLYCLGDLGTNVICRNSYHAEMIDFVADNLAVVDEPSSKGSGNEVNLEQLYLWDPEVIIFAPQSYYAEAASNPEWQALTAIESGKYYEVPYAVYNWMGFPPSVQRYLGLLWMLKLLYPQQADYDLYTEVQSFYQLFFHCELTQQQYAELMANSVGKTVG